MSVFASIFSCCGARRAQHDQQDVPDERTRLLPSQDDPTAIQRHVVDQERMKERLTVIVRAKEGKMVNLHAPLPFNLHNAALARSASRVSVQPSLDDDTASQSASSSSAPTPDADADEPRPPLNVRLVRAAPALRGRSSIRRISPTTVSKRDDAGEHAESIADPADGDAEVHPGPSTARAFAIQPVGSFSRSWGD